MRQRYIARKLFRNSFEADSFLDLLNIPKEQNDLMLESRDTVRKALRVGFETLRENGEVNGAIADDVIKQLKPKFFTQGSFAYKTQNLPACSPPQQIDLDDGVYFPMSIVEGDPNAGKIALANIVGALLTDLAEKKGWGFKKKHTCYRLIVNSLIHLDVPIYAIPQEKYVQLSEARASLKNNVFDIETYERLDPNEVYLAVLDENEKWLKSDPKLLHDWFTNQAKRYKHLRNVCRYLKAWRDFHWDKGGPSSIMLMVAVTEVFENAPRDFDRDCTALLEVTKQLPTIFSKDIVNPTAPDENMFPSRCEDEVSEIRSKIRDLSINIQHALCNSQNKQEVIDTLRVSLGDRIPNQVDWVELNSIADTIRKSPAVTSLVPAANAAKSHVSG